MYSKMLLYAKQSWLCSLGLILEAHVLAIVHRIFREGSRDFNGVDTGVALGAALPLGHPAFLRVDER